MRTDVLVVGSGIAGSSAAIRAVEKGADVTVVTEATRPDDTNTGWAQGGVAKRAPEERAEEFVEDVLDAGAGEGDEDAVELLVEEGTEVVEEFLVDELGVDFDADSTDGEGDDEFDLAREGGHSRDRVLHKGDATGLAVQRALLRRLAETDARVLEAHSALELVKDEEEERVEGALVVDRDNGEAFVVEAGATVLATGGIGDVYGRRLELSFEGNEVKWESSVGRTTITETIFAWPGMGRVMVQAIYARDNSVVQAGLLVTSLLIIGSNLVVDILYAFLDPRIRYS